jgi:hypothetical protein
LTKMSIRRWPVIISLALAVIGLALVLYAASAYPTASVSGKVLRLDGQPASGAWVRVQTTDNLTYAASDGSFTLSGLVSPIQSRLGNGGTSRWADYDHSETL